MEDISGNFRPMLKSVVEINNSGPKGQYQDSFVCFSTAPCMTENIQNKTEIPDSFIASC